MQREHTFRYTDPVYGAALRKLLNPARSKAVLNTYFDNLSARLEQPDVVKQLEPMLRRYEKAFVEQPKDFEQDYLDIMEVTVLIIERSMSSKITPVPASSTTLIGDRFALQKLLEGAREILSWSSEMAGQSIRDKVHKGLFSVAGAQRALEFAQRMDGNPAVRAEAAGLPFGSGTSPLPVAKIAATPYADMTQEQKRKLGERVYTHHCAACHQADGRGFGPIPSLHNAPKLASNEAAIRVVLVGVEGGIMPSWKNLDNVDVAEVVNFIRNSFGNFSIRLAAPNEVQKQRE